MWRKLALTFVLCTLMGWGLLAVPAHADNDSISRGDVERALHAYVTGARVVTRYADGNGVVDYDVSDVSMRPFGSNFHFCVDDHYLANIAWFTSNDTYPAASAGLGTITNELYIDGQAVEAIRTPVVALPGPVRDPMYFGFNEGYIIEPGSLQPGEHTYGVAIYIGDLDLELAFERPFTVDAAGTGTCQ